MRYAAILRAAMDERGVGTVALAKAIGVSRVAVRDYLTGKYLPASAVAWRIAEALDNVRLYGEVVRGRRTRCLHCGTDIVSEGTAHTRKWCNSTCRDRSRRGYQARPSAEQLALQAMCRRCEPKGVCFDGSCPLRRWSPFPLAPDAITPLAEPSEAWPPERRAAAAERMRERMTEMWRRRREQAA